MMALLEMRLLNFGLLVLISHLIFSNAEFSSVYDDNNFDAVVVHARRKLATKAQRQLNLGDYAQYPDSCPLITTCPMMCISNTTECPTECPTGENLCNDGSCSKEACDETLENPCWCEPLVVVCPRPIDYFDNCVNDYGTLYDDYKLCVEEYEENLEQVSYSGQVFLFCYIWMLSLTIFVFWWCLFNQVLFPVKGSVRSLIPVVVAEENEDEKWTQIGYKTSLIGGLLNILVWVTLFAIHGLLLFLTLCYYTQQLVISPWPIFFLDEVQVLFVFQIVWMVGLVWSFAFMWPETIGSLFLRRCKLSEASVVAIVAPIRRVESSVPKSQITKLCHEFVRVAAKPFNFVLRLYFSYPKYNPNHETVFCPVDQQTYSFVHRLSRYVYSETDSSYIPGTIELGKTIGELMEMRTGLSTDQAHVHYKLVGRNCVQLPKPSLLWCLYTEFAKPFYLYQTFILWTWFNFWYYHMALIATFVRIIGGTVSAVFKFKTDSTLYKLSTVDGELEVIRDGERCSINAKDVVPGDVVVLRPGAVYCDMVVLDSKHLLIDESALTGESNPVFKCELDTNMSKMEYNENGFKQNTIFCGTTIIEAGVNDKDLGLVVATGSFTKKGQLLSDILSYQRHKFQFDDEIVPVLCILFVEAAVLVTMVFNFLGDQYVFSWFYAMFIIATIFPPLLPTVFVISVGISAERLEKKRITCTNPEGILIAGKVNVCCFDKTGTLTEAGMNASGIESYGNEYLAKQTRLGMSVCHNLQKMSTGEIIGNEVDKAAFQYTRATICTEESRGLEIEYNGERIVLLKQNLFDNVLVTQSVIAELPDKKLVTFVKGSAEAIRALCRPETIPSSFDDTLRDGSKEGLYLLAMAFKDLTNDALTKTDVADDVELKHLGNPTLIPRAELESSLTFCGFVKFENVLKAETCGVIQDLKAGNVLITMITGDNVLTGIRMAREAGICTAETTILARKVDKASIEWVNVDAEQVVSPPYDMSKSFDVAVTGEAWFHLLNEEPEYAQSIAKYIRVFGRCNPAHKVSVVSTLVEQGYVTLMCGDGQNDCGAIKAAHVGVALSTADASVVAPFTSLDLTVSSVSEILREGRCALSSALKVYCYFMLYGQLCSFLQTINAYFATTFNGWAWIFIDGAMPVLLAFSLPLSKAATKLSACRPTASLFGPRTLSTMCGIIGWNLVFLTLAYYLLFQQDWFQCRKWDGTDVSGAGEIQDNYETIVSFVVGGYQLVSAALALSFGYSFREAWYKNYWFVGLILLFSVIHFTITLYPSKLSCAFRVNCAQENIVLDFAQAEKLPIMNYFNTTVIPVEFRWTLVMIMIANTITVCAWEFFFVNTYLYNIYDFGRDESLAYTSIGGSITLSTTMEF